MYDPKIVVAALLLFGLLQLNSLNTARRLVREGRYSEALPEIEKALGESPRNPEVQYQAGEILKELGVLRAAKLVELAPDSAEAHELLGRFLEAQGSLDAALVEYRAALSRKPELAGLHFLTGSVLWKQRSFAAAREELEAELRIHSNDVLAHLRLGQTLLALNEPSVAVDHLRAALAGGDSEMEARRELGKAYRALGNNADALVQFNWVARLRPRDEQIHAQLASVYRALGDKTNTAVEMEKHRRIIAEKAEASRKQQLSNGR